MKDHQSRKDPSFQPPAAQRSNPFQPRPFGPIPAAQTPADQAPAAPDPILHKASFLTFSIPDPTGTSRQPIQPKLTIGAPGDRYEQEADRVASQVVQQIHEPQTNAPLQRDSLEEDERQRSPMLQRLEMPGEDEMQMKPLLQRNTLEEDELQMRPRPEAVAGGPASESLESAISQARGSGQSLDPNLQRQMGQAMGADLSGVTIHTDTQSDQLNRSIQAKAFTTGQDIFFRQGAYQPGSRNGQELIAHELTHVVQQNSSLSLGQTVQQSSEVSLGLVQREVIPARSPEADPTITDDVLKENYNSAWDYLWSSPNAQKIYQYVHNLKTNTGANADTIIEVGSSDSDAEIGKVRWNPWEYNIQLDQPQLPAQAVDTGQKIDYSQVTGISSSAITLLHELGHIKQHHEAANIDASVDPGSSALSKDLAELVRKVYGIAKPLLNPTQQKQLLTSDRLVVEEDNVTRHERPTATDLPEEPTRAGYEYSGPNANASSYYEQNLIQVLSEIDALPTADRVQLTLLRHSENEPPVVAKTAKDKFQELLDALNQAPPISPPFKVQRHQQAVAKLQSYIDAMNAAETDWQSAIVDPSLQKPVWT